MGNQIGGALTAQLTPVIAKYFGWSMPFSVAAGLCALGALLWLTVDVQRGLIQLSAGPRANVETLGALND